MKKLAKYFLFILLIVILTATGCVKRENADQPAPGTPAPVGANEPTPTPVPTPSPLPYDVVAENTAPEYSFASDYQAAAEALWAIRENAAENPLTALFSQDAPAVSELKATRLQDETPDGGSICSDGRYLYILSGKDLTIVGTDGGEAKVVSVTSVGVDWNGEDNPELQTVYGWEKTPLAVYPMGDRLAVIGDCYGYNGSSGDPAHGVGDLTYTEYTSVDIYSIADPAAPVQLSGFGQDGTFQSAGVNGGTLFVLSDFEVFRDIDPAVPTSFVPRLYEGEQAAVLPAGSCFIAPHGSYSGYSLIGTYDLASASRTGALALVGLGPDAYEADGSLFFVTNRWSESYSRTLEENGWNVDETAVAQCSEIFRFDVTGPVALRTAAVAEGAIPDASALDFRGGELRYAARLRHGLYTGSADDPLWRDRQTGVRVAVLDGDLRLVSAADDTSASGSVSWVGLLSDTAVTTTAAGVSRLVSLPGGSAAFGADTLADTVLADVILPWGTQGYMVFYQPEGGKLTLSVRDGALWELSGRSFGSDHSNTLESRECYLADESINVFGFAADDSYCIYGLDETGDLVFRKDVFLNDWAWNTRCIPLDGRLYVADTREVFTLDAGTLEILDQLTF